MKISETSLPGVLLLTPKAFGDARGWFLESWQQERYAEAGIGLPFVQDNVSFSKQGTLRGLHFQNPFAQGKLVSVVHGAVFDVAVDIRAGSPHFGKWYGTVLSDENHQQLWIPPGFAHGFYVVSASAVFSYKCTEIYRPEGDAALRWDDPAIGIAWPPGARLLSDKDNAAPLLRDIPAARLNFGAAVGA